MSHPYAINAAKCVLSAAAFYLAAVFGLAHGTYFGSVTPLWPATGVAIVAVYWFGAPGVLGVCIGSLTSSAAYIIPFELAAIFAFVNCSEAVAASYMLRKITREGDHPFHSTKGTIQFLSVCAVLIPALTALIGVTAVTFFYEFISLVDVGVRWVTWFVGDMLGAVVIAPLLLIIAPRRFAASDLSWLHHVKNPALTKERFLYGLVFVMTNCVIFLYPLFLVGSDIPTPSLVFTIVPVLMWAAFRLGQSVSIISIALHSTAAILATVNALGPFSVDSVLGSIIVLQFYIATMSSSTLLIASVVSERTLANAKLRRVNENLEDLVAKRTQQALDSRRQLDYAMKAADVGSWVWDVKLGEVTWDVSLYGMLGYDSEKMSASFDAFMERIHPDDLAMAQENASNIDNRGPHFEDEFRIIRTDGVVRNLMTRGEIQVDDNGVANRVIGVCLDMTEQLRMRHDLRENNRILGELSDNMHEIFWMRDCETGQFLFVSAAYERIWGRLRSALYLNPDDWIPGVHLDDMHIVTEAPKEIPACGFIMEYRVVADRERWVRERWFIVHNEEGKAYRKAGIITDITEEKEAERLRIEQSAVKEANKAKTRFLANVSHEMRTPLTSIRGFIELIQDEGTSAEKHAKYAKIIEQSSSHLECLIDDLLDMSKVESGQLDLVMTQVELPDQINAAIDCVKGGLAENVELEVRYVGTVPRYFKTDCQRFRQILINLVGNAVKFTEEGRIEVIVSFERFDAKRPYLRILVRDTGVGIPKSFHKDVFQPFMSLKQGRYENQKGSGLGLALSKSLARCLGGDVTMIKSEPERGSVFEFTVELVAEEPELHLINVRDDHEAASPRAATAFKNTAKAQPIRDKVVLLAEDVYEIQILVKSYLELAGATVIVCDNGKKAIQAIAQANSVDAVIMDMQMPVMDGYQATSLLRSRGFKAPIIALTAHAMSEDRQNCLKAGCNDYLSKPVNPTVMVETIANLTDEMCGLQKDQMI